MVSLYHPADGQQTKPDLQMTILHTNDLHAHDEVYVEHAKSVGGFARIGHLIRTLRKENPNTVVCDAGDIFQGTPLFAFYHGEVEVNNLNLMGYDVYTIGNHEFDDGPDNLAKQLSKAKFAIVSSNMDTSNFPPLGNLVKPSVVKIIGGEKVAFVGAVTPDLEQLSMSLAPIKLKAKGPQWYEPIKAEVERLKGEGINKIILVSHCGVKLEKELAQEIPDIDVIVGGHSHTRLDKAVIFEHPGVGTTMVVQTGCYGKALGKLDLAFDKDGKLIFPETKYHLINITERIPEEKDIKDYIESKLAPVLVLRNEKVATATTEFDKDWISTPWDSALGDLIADALFDAGKKFGAQISFENRGGIRGTIDAGPISAEKIEEILPFDNRLTIATVDGATLLKALEHSFEEGLGGRFLDEHGLKIAYDRNLPLGHRIVFVLTQQKDGSWQPLKPEQKYRIAINSFSFSGGEGFDFKSATDKDFHPDKMSAVMREYLKEHPQVGAAPPSRIVPVTEGLLEVDSKREKMHLRHIPDGSEVRLFVGKNLGVDTVDEGDGRKVPVPLSAAKFVEQSTVHGSEFDWKLPLKKVDSDEKYASVIVMPPSFRSDKKIEISAPIQIKQ
jgi:5'-nucleotidase / UDP-sugar diphosphatase